MWNSIHFLFLVRNKKKTFDMKKIENKLASYIYFLLYTLPITCQSLQDEIDKRNS